MPKINIKKLLEKKGVKKTNKEKVKPFKAPKSKIEEMFDIDMMDCETVFVPGDKDYLKCKKCKDKIYLEEITKCYFNDIKIRKVGYCCDTIYLVEGEVEDAI